ncbi:hypothetical protein FVF58_49490, partial [Paraburkholderia panacisoli]
MKITAFNNQSGESLTRVYKVSADSTGGCNTLKTAQAVGVLQMKQRRRIYYSETQKALMWERWQKGESLQKIA